MSLPDYEGCPGGTQENLLFTGNTLKRAGVMGIMAATYSPTVQEENVRALFLEHFCKSVD